MGLRHALPTLALKLALLATGLGGASYQEARPPPPQAEEVDLVVLALEPSPAAPDAGDNVTFRANVQNRGSGDAGAFRVAFEVDDVSLGNASVGGLAAGATVTVASPAWRAAPGNHNARAVADSGGEVAESDEGNNERSASLTVAAGPEPLPDLVVRDVSWSPAQPSAGSVVRLNATVANEGSAAARDFVVRFLLDGLVAGEVAVNASLAPSAARNVSCCLAGPLGAGEHEARVVADATNATPEASEGNNERTETIRVAGGARPDLRVRALALSPEAPAAGDRVAVTAVVENRGAGNASAFRVALLADGDLVGEVALPGLEAGAARNVTLPAWNATAGNHVLRAVADPGNEVAEGDEANNALSVNVTVAPRAAPRTARPTPPAMGPPGPAGLPDLVVAGVRQSVADPRPGEVFPFSAVIGNQGSAPATNFRVEFLVDAESLGTASLAGLAPGASEEVLSPAWAAAPGQHTLLVLADPGNAVAEASEDNNAAIHAVVVGEAGRAEAPRPAPGPGLASLLAALALLAAARRCERA